jgi:phenylalanyl-tRNA synthetase alpha chain
MNIKILAEKLHPLERKVLPYLKSVKTFKELVAKSGLKDVEVMRALQWLQNKGVISIKENVKEVVMLDKNGKLYAEKGLPEKRFLKSIDGTTNIAIIQKKAKLDGNEINICIGLLKRKAAVDVIKDGGLKVKITDNGKKLLTKDSLEEQFLKTLSKVRELKSLKPEENFALQELRKRKELVKVDVVKTKSLIVSSIGKRLLSVKIDDKVVDRLTPKMLTSGVWKNKKFRRYDVGINVPTTFGGKRHFVNQTIEYAKQIWLDLGFKEMTGDFIQTSFWDLDSLFVPQDHPARQMQDTFFLKKPSHGKLPKDYKKVKEVHENGGNTGSSGWGGKWSEEKAKELLLRTHTTVLSAKKLTELKEEDLPAKFFNIGKVFRNEALDWKHLFEFYQVDGIVVDPNANFKNLIAYLKEFFGKMGFPDARIRPAHFPYTEPSAEIEVLHPVHKEWVELGGCGVFRPEVVKPLLGIDVPVLAWGFGLGRILCPYYKINDLRHIYNNDLKQIRDMKIWMK